MKFLLVIAILAGSGGGSGKASITTETFDSLHQCQQAAFTIEKQLYNMKRWDTVRDRYSAACYHIGSAV